jgi:very-short-patch-repair endonuclease
VRIPGLSALLVLALVAVAVVAVALARRRPLRLVEGGAPPYFGKKPLTDAEREMFVRLQAAMPECVVLAQVALSSLVGIKERPDRRMWFNRISQKSVDFVLCLPNDFTVVTVIELDDLSHARPDRVRADTAKDVALRVAGHPIVRLKARPTPSVAEIRTRGSGLLPFGASPWALASSGAILAVGRAGCRRPPWPRPGAECTPVRKHILATPHLEA